MTAKEILDKARAANMDLPPVTPGPTGAGPMGQSGVSPSSTIREAAEREFMGRGGPPVTVPRKLDQAEHGGCTPPVLPLHDHYDDLIKALDDHIESLKRSLETQGRTIDLLSQIIDRMTQQEESADDVEPANKRSL